MSTLVVVAVLAGCTGSAGTDEDDAITPTTTDELQVSCSVTSDGATLVTSTPVGHLVVSGDVLLGSRGNEIVSISRRTGKVKVLAKTRKDVLALASDDTTVYASLTDDRTFDIVAIPKSGGELTQLSRAAILGWGGRDETASLVVHDGTLLWNEPPNFSPFGFGSTGVIKSLALTTPGAAPKELAAVSYVKSIAANDQHVYWASIGGVARVQRDGGRPEIVSTGGADRLYLDGEHVVWSDGISFLTRSVRRRSITLAGDTAVVAKNAYITLLGAHDGKLVFGDRGVAFTYDPSSAKSDYAACFGEGLSMLAEGNAVYWTTRDGIYSAEL